MKRPCGCHNTEAPVMFGKPLLNNVLVHLAVALFLSKHSLRRESPSSNHVVRCTRGKASTSTGTETVTQPTADYQSLVQQERKKQPVEY